jgi:RNA polymerase sigma-70 factor (ECF subfamily)
MQLPTHADATTRPSPATPHEADAALVERLGAGDDEALRTLHQRYAALVFTVAARFVDAATAEDVVQDVFVTLWKKHDTFDPARGSFKSWLIQIARRRALNELRRAEQRAPHSDETLSELADDSLEPDEAQWLAHRRKAIRAAIDALPAAQRQALSLAFFGELTHDQIALILQTKLGTTKTRIRLALKRLAPLLMALLAATAAVLGLRWLAERSARSERALRMVTTSDVVPRRLHSLPGTPAAAHGTFRQSAASSVAVLTTSHLPAIAAPDRYVAWAHRPSGWQKLGPVALESDGRSLLVSELSSRSLADEVRVTRESGSAAGAPLGPSVLSWSALDAAAR